MPLRDYQQECIANIRKAREAGVSKMLCVSPTGSGKAVMLAHVPQALGQKPGEQSLILVHRKELVSQLADKLSQYNPTLKVGIERAQFRCDADADLIVASVQTIGKAKGDDPDDDFNDRLRQFDPNRLRHLIIDECHHVRPDSDYGRVLRYFNVFKPDFRLDDPSKNLLGFTATPARQDGLGLETILDEIVFSRDLRTMMSTGITVNGKLRPWLCEVKAFRVETDVDISTVATRQGDFAVGELEETVNTPARNKLIVEKYRELGEGMTAFAFTCDIQHSTDLADEFQKAGIQAYAISGNTPDAERKRLMSAFAIGQIKVLSSCGVLCLDEETEILTSQGWIDIDGMTYAHKVANWADGSIYFKEPSAIVQRQRHDNEHMVGVVCQDFNIRVTEGHNMLYRTWRVEEAKYKKCKAVALVGRRVQIPCSGILREDSGISVAVEQEAHTNSRRLISALKYKIRSTDIFTTTEAAHAEATRRVARKLALKYKQPSELTLAECGFIGFWVGDGTTTKMQRGGVEHILCQSSRYVKIIEWIRSTLAAMGVDYIERAKRAPSGKGNSMPYQTWSIPRGTGGGDQARRGIYHLEPYLNKQGSPLWWGFNEAQFNAFVQGLWLADGSHGIDGVHTKKSFQIHGTAARKCLDTVQAIAVCHGYYANLKLDRKSLRNPKHNDLQVLTLKKCAHLAIATKPLQIEQDWKAERVWCVTSDSGNIVTRRRGKVLVTGNSEGIDIPSVGVLLMARPTKSSLLFRQQVGRGLRPSPSPEEYAVGWTGAQKKYCVVVDFCDVAGKHAGSLNTVASLFGLRPNFDMKGKNALEVVEEVEGIVSKTPGVNLSLFSDLEKLRGAAVEIDLFSKPAIPDEIRQNSQLAWTTGMAIGTYQMSFDRTMLVIRQNALGAYEISRHIQGVRTPLGSAGDLARALSLAEIEVPSEWFVRLQADAQWRFTPPTDKQLGFYAKLYPEVRKIYASDADFATAIKARYDKGELSMLITQREKPRTGKPAWAGRGR